jgi:hypothetical protein
MRAVNLVRTDPHLPLAVAAAAVLAGEWRQAEAGVRWPLFEAAVFGVAFALAWRRRSGLHLVPLLLATLLFELASIAIHVHVGAGRHEDPIIYGQQGRTLLHGSYPSSEYPVGAVALFAFESWISGGSMRTGNALTMVPFHLLTVVAVWLIRSRWSRWLAAFVALWPLNLFYWEFRFDLAPAALLTVGLLLAYQERWTLSAVALSVGALVKWTPGVAAVGLVVWLIASGRAKVAGRYALAFILPILLTYLPLLAWRPTEVMHAYTAQGSRGITNESLPFLVLHWLGRAQAGSFSPDPASVPTWGDNAAIAGQILALLAIVALLARVRERAAAVALAAILPAAFLITNRVFSPQFFVVAIAAWSIAFALVTLSERQVVVLTGAIAAATLGNAVVWPALDFPLSSEPGWIFASAAALLFGAAVTLRLALSASTGSPRSASERANPRRVAA